MSQKKKIAIISGSPRKRGDGIKVVEQLIQHFNEPFDIEFLFVKDFMTKPCLGCMACQKKEGDFCPIKDDLHLLKAKIKEADGIIFISPVYNLMISGEMKLFFDRLSSWIHRPENGGKPAILLCTTMFAGGEETLDYLQVPVINMGFHITGKQYVLSGVFKNNERYKIKIQKKLKKMAARFEKIITAEKKTNPGVKEILIFNKWKYKTLFHKKQYPGDYDFWQKKGYHDADYYYPCKINPLAGLVIPFFIRLFFGIMDKRFGFK